MVFLKVSPAKGTLRFVRWGKLARRYIGPFEITDGIGEIVYRLEFPSELTGVHNVFHTPMLNKYVADPSHVLDHEPLEVRDDATYVERPMCIIDTREQVLRTKMISWFKVLWENHTPRNHLGVQGSNAGVSLSSS